MPENNDGHYRPCAGICLFNPHGLVFVGQRMGGRNAETSEFMWQMPQGGIDPDEDPEIAARRELYEETNIRSVRTIGEIPRWLRYDLPRGAGKGGWRNRFRGQTQKWFAFRFEGNESEIDVLTPADGAHKAEFVGWKWVPLAQIPSLVVPFKRPVYEQVAAGFSQYAVAV